MLFDGRENLSIAVAEILWQHKSRVLKYLICIAVAIIIFIFIFMEDHILWICVSNLNNCNR
jgi:hypothetical protein